MACTVGRDRASRPVGRDGLAGLHAAACRQRDELRPVALHRPKTVLRHKRRVRAFWCRPPNHATRAPANLCVGSLAEMSGTMLSCRALSGFRSSARRRGSPTQPGRLTGWSRPRPAPVPGGDMLCDGNRCPRLHGCIMLACAGHTLTHTRMSRDRRGRRADGGPLQKTL